MLPRYVCLCCVQANTVLFACGSIESCHRIGDELVGVVDPNTVLRMDLAGHSDATQKGEVQARLATFLGKHPQGIVVLPQVDRIPLHLLAVLNNVMGEGGSLYQDGTAVTTSEATFFMTIEVAPALMAEESSVDLTLAVKTYLQQALLKGSDQEGTGVRLWVSYALLYIVLLDIYVHSPLCIVAHV